MMSNKLEWYDENSFCTGRFHAENDRGHEVDPKSPDAERWDLWGALRISYYDDTEFWTAVDKAKKAFKFLFKEKYKYLESDPDRRRPATLYEMNDMMTYTDIQRLMLFLD